MQWIAPSEEDTATDARERGVPLQASAGVRTQWREATREG